MKLSLSIPGFATFDEMIAASRSAADAGLHGVWLNEVGSWDSVTAAAALAVGVPELAWGTSVVPSYPRHPLVTAAAALTAQAASNGRFTLGIGPSHANVIAGTFGLTYNRPAAHTREYLTMLRPLLRGDAVSHRGEWFTADGQLSTPKVHAPEVVISALGPRMLQVAGELADGTIALWIRPDYVRTVIRPAMEQAAEGVGRPTPRVIACVIASVTDRPDEVTKDIARALGAASELPSYRALLDRQGISSTADTVLVGSADAVATAIEEYRDAGVDEVVVNVWGQETQPTTDLLGQLQRSFA